MAAVFIVSPCDFVKYCLFTVCEALTASNSHTNSVYYYHYFI